VLELLLGGSAEVSGGLVNCAGPYRHAAIINRRPLLPRFKVI